MIQDQQVRMLMQEIKKEDVACNGRGEGGDERADGSQVPR